MLKKILYIIWIAVFGVLLALSLKNGSFVKFIEFSENKTFDIRQSLISDSGLRKHSQDIAIVAIDDSSYEYILDNYGEWPLRRDIYAKMVDYIETQHPKAIAFDLMFVKSLKSKPTEDAALINIFKKYNNVYTAMNLDNQPEDLRIPINLPEKLSIKVNMDNNATVYTNCRGILPDIIRETQNIGMINVSRSEDGVLREMPLYLKYGNDYYPQLGYLLGKMYSQDNDIPALPLVQKNSNIILNWYGQAGTFENIPMYKLLKSIDTNTKLNYNFKDKIVYFGATASSLFDIKTTPVDKLYPGVEVQTTYVNNLLDNSYIRKCSNFINVCFALLLGLLTILIVLKLDSMALIICSNISIYGLYIVLTYYMMAYHNLWLKIIMPISFGIFIFIFAVITKYLIKSRDFDYQYKLATTDGLTELYNHRYFQEQLLLHINQAQRYNEDLSLIILDIDLFKHFNDTYGHQSGDAVLKQVASILKHNVRTTDIVCRYGGEEMSIILPKTSNVEAIKLAQKLCNLVASQPFKLSQGRESNVTISLGVSTYPQDGKTKTEIIENADKRLYNAKENGRNKVN